MEQFIRACPNCAKYHRGTPTKRGAMQIATVGEPWERLGVDVVGPFPRSRNCFVFMVTVIDLFMKWAFAVPTRNHEASTIAKILVENVFSNFGMCRQILTDLGSDFQSRL